MDVKVKIKIKEKEVENIEYFYTRFKKVMGFICMDKQLIKTQIKEWVKLDDDISLLKDKIKEHNQKKKIITENLLHIMKEQEIDAFDLNNEGKLIRQVRKSKSALTKKFIMSSLTTYFKDDEKAKKASDFILESRVLKLNESICKK